MTLERRRRHRLQLIKAALYSLELFLVAQLVLWIVAPSSTGYGTGFSLWFKALLSSVAGVLLVAWIPMVLVPFIMLQAVA
jgi:hypothetical protein